MNETLLTCLSSRYFKSRLKNNFFPELSLLKENERNFLVGARSRREREREGKKKVLYLQSEKCFHRSLIN